MARTARVMFDEAHGQAWSIRPEAAAAMQPAHPADSSYALAAAALVRRGLAVAAHTDGALTRDVLAHADVLVLAHPSDRKWEKTLGGSPVLSGDEIDAVHSWVLAGGGLIVLGETEQDKYGNNVNALLARFGMRVEHATVYDYERQHGSPSWVLGERAAERAFGTDLLARVREVCFYRAGTVEPGGDGVAVLCTSPAADPAGAPLAAVAEIGEGRVAALADSDLFGDDCLADLDHEALWTDLVHWAAHAAFARRDPAPAVAGAADASITVDPGSTVTRDEHWLALKAETDALRLLQEPDGSVDTTVHDAAVLTARVDRMAAAVAALRPRFAHQHEYLDAVAEDLRDWVAAGFTKPDFTRSAESFRPERQRADGIEHLVLFPMYTQNGSRDTRFEALVVRVPWPAWLAGLERDRYDNPKFVPVTFVDTTAGYHSECAVLFPETFSVAGRSANHFGAIFCDREAERFRRVATAAADLLRLNLPADAAALLASPELSQDAFVLWDLVHDRAHSRGDLPFDPFMIRQRMPYWMYSLEELRCDLTAFAEAVRLEAEGLAIARQVQYAILFDRLFRFPVTGARVRNYDGLGGQLLFAFLHHRGTVRWTDNKLTIDWAGVADGVIALRGAVEELYRTGIDLPKVVYWMRAHELVSRFVAPAVTSVWKDGARELLALEDPRAWIDRVQPDEFPLSVFYTSLQAKLEPVIAAAPPTPAAAVA